MQRIDITRPLTDAEIPGEPIVLVLGFFDGLHRGHQAVIRRAREEADKRHAPLALMTFNVHPSVVYGDADEATFKYLSTLPRKEELAAGLGVDLFYVAHFTPEFARLGPQAFVDQYLVRLKAAVVVAGFDYTYGKRDVANMELLPGYARGRFDVITVPEQTMQGNKISSTRIRTALAGGDIDAANELLGYGYQTTGKVVHGEARGRELGFPTLNIETPVHEWVPGVGIYVTRVRVRGQWYGGMASVGYNVTFGAGRALTVEINLFDFSQDVYGETVTVEWYHRLRGEVKFDGAAGLIKQLHQDEANSRTYLAQHPQV
ncbi:riboflavin biosynthesis protein RibF [Lacticaseibacillus pantheris]|uniref:Riboflavin biosynthesis protein n=1 Tax=Lacticaseibacillus pantheris DSM 15945 = JCM 12539 = NBRC 106106 TaxID=1423783 RepID=A0A0R1U2C9_9LACO|nr:riboflavin biosynthesis protein RibF [Lacticaseibacillus pantheris]KRL86756.1 hypothetical protein FC50_GL000400 [Lacticaseibacillus pantheris DSM 15945 = JCM 12539 = NBRC 106106]